MVTELISDPCRKIVVAVHQSDVSDCVNNETLNEVFRSCQTIQVEVAYYYLRLLLSEYYLRHYLGSSCTDYDPSSAFILRLYTFENRSLLFQDLSSGRADVYPFEIMINHNTIQKYYISTPSSISKYNFYVNNAIISQSYQQSSPLTFLTSPFTNAVWICMATSALAAFILILIIRFVHKKKLPFLNATFAERLAYALIFTPLVTLTVPYCSSLKALVLQPAVSQPFSSLVEFSNLIKSGQFRIVIESSFSRRKTMLTNPNFNRSSGLQSVYEALQMKEGSLVDTSNMTHVCYLLENYPKEYVYFGYDDILLTSCESMCFWNFALTEDVDQMFSFLIGKKATVLTRLADVFSHAIPNYRQLEMNRKYKAHCSDKMKTSASMIDSASLMMAFVLLGIGLILSVIAMLDELIRPRCCPTGCVIRRNGE